MTLIELCGQLILAVILIQDPCMTLKTRLKAPYTLHSSCAYSVEVLLEHTYRCTAYITLQIRIKDSYLRVCATLYTVWKI